MTSSISIWNDFDYVRKKIEAKHPNANFMNGECMLFHLELKEIFPTAVPLFNVEHVVTLVDGGAWDHTGMLWTTELIEPALYKRYLNRTQEFLNENVGIRSPTGEK